MVIQMDRLPLDGRIIGGYAWDDSVHRVFTFRHSVGSSSAPFCLGEICGARVRRDHVSHTVQRGVEDQRGNPLQPFAGPPAVKEWCLTETVASLVTPPRSKPDQWGETHCPFTIFIGLSAREGDPCDAIRDIELREACPDGDRETIHASVCGRGRFAAYALDPRLAPQSRAPPRLRRGGRQDLHLALGSHTCGCQQHPGRQVR